MGHRSSLTVVCCRSIIQILVQLDHHYLCVPCFLVAVVLAPSALFYWNHLLWTVDPVSSGHLISHENQSRGSSMNFLHTLNDISHDQYKDPCAQMMCLRATHICLGILEFSSGYSKRGVCNAGYTVLLSKTSLLIYEHNF